MCGITALIDHERDGRGDLERMTQTLRHRGPDDCGIWQSPDGAVVLGHQRLSILDLSPAGRNPMSWGGGRYWITYNGEVYNFGPLRKELEAGGARFASHTDTEVILAAYERWGTVCFEKLIGMFALAIWDAGAGRLVLARDRVGKKPLYYADYGGRFAVASELKALAADPRFPRTVDERAVALYLRYGYVPAPFTIYAHARKLLPGHFAIVEKGDLRATRYWDPLPGALGAPAGPAADAEAQLESLLGDAVRLRMVADVPVGAFLSGGIDSSLVVALMQEQASTPVKTFTIRFEDREYNESDHAAAVARHLRTEHHEQLCTGQEMLDVVDDLPLMFDEPFGDSSAIPTYIVSRVARQRVTVALSGDGGDELFFGYPRYRHHARAGWLLSAPRPLRRAAARVAAALPRRRFRRVADVLRLDDADHYGRFVRCWGDAEIRALTAAELLEAPLYAEVRRRTESLPAKVRPPLLDLMTYLPEDILTKVDRASMRVSLETRCPLLDHRVVEFALALPLDLKWRGGETKWLLRRMLERRLPRQLFDRPKMGFGVPIGAWLRTVLKARVDRLLNADACLEQVALDPGAVRRLWRAFLAGREELSPQIWNLFALASWADQWQPQSTVKPAVR